jgi:hypothetical protein
MTKKFLQLLLFIFGFYHLARLIFALFIITAYIIKADKDLALSLAYSSWYYGIYVLFGFVAFLIISSIGGLNLRHKYFKRTYLIIIITYIIEFAVIRIISL